MKNTFQLEIMMKSTRGLKNFIAVAVAVAKKLRSSPLIQLLLLL